MAAGAIFFNRGIWDCVLDRCGIFATVRFSTLCQASQGVWIDYVDRAWWPEYVKRILIPRGKSSRKAFRLNRDIRVALLVAACEQGDYSFFAHLLAQPEITEQCLKRCFPFLVEQLKHNHKERLLRLLFTKCRVKIGHFAGQEWPILFGMCRRRAYGPLKFLLEKFKFGRQTRHKYEIDFLLLACSTNHIGITRLVIQKFNLQQSDFHRQSKSTAFQLGIASFAHWNEEGTMSPAFYANNRCTPEFQAYFREELEYPRWH